MKKKEGNVAKNKKAKASSAKKITKGKVAAPKKVAKKASVKKTATQKSKVIKSKVKKATRALQPNKKAKPVKAAKTVKSSKLVKTTKTLKTAQPASKIKAAPVMGTSSKAKTTSFEMSQFLSPLADRIFIVMKEAEKKTLGGIFIPDTSEFKNGFVQGRVVAKGPGRKDKKGKVHPVDVQLGDVVMISEHSGSRMKIQNQEVVVLEENEVIGIVEKE